MIKLTRSQQWLWLTAGLFTFLIAFTAGQLWQMVAQAQAGAQRACSSGFAIEHQLGNGSVWDMCWSTASDEGIILYDIYFTPANGTRYKVLSQANLAQIHVPYDSGSPRFHDLSDYGLGDGNLDTLIQDDCPQGQLRSDGSRNVLCITEAPVGHRHLGLDEQIQGTAFTVFHVSHIVYNYVVNWTFHDDGTLEPAVGATGVLVISGGGTSYGWPLGSGASNYWQSHHHNYFWRLDFDLGVSTAADTIEQLDFNTTDGTARTLDITSITSEAARLSNPETFRAWRIFNNTTTNSDDHNIGYLLSPTNNHRFVGTSSEQFAQNEVYFTAYKACERWASHNPTTPPGGGVCAENLANFVNGETLNNADVVTWISVNFHHLPRDEDQDKLYNHFDGFKVLPHDLSSSTPLLNP